MAIAALRVVPPTVELSSGESQVFEAYGEDGKPAGNLKWSVAREGVGTIVPESGVYSAPARAYRSRRLAVVAKQIDDKGIETGRGSAVVDIDQSRTWIPLLGGGWIVFFVLLLLTLLLRWQDLCPQCEPSGLLISPPVVTLSRGQAQQFLTNATVTWTNTVNLAGLYIAPAAIDAEQVVTVTATSKSDPEQSAMGIVRLSPVAGLTILPSKVTVNPGQEVQLTASVTGAAAMTPIWLPPAAGTITPDGKYTAPNVRQPQAIVVLAQAQIPASGITPASTLLAGALVSVVETRPGPCDAPGSTIWRLILLVAWVGALGGLTHAMGSFGTYVGNRELKPSWLWWYGLKPVLSAAVAVLVFLVFRAGLAPDLGLATGDCLKVAGFAGLVGLFAEPATVKLKDIFDAFFTPRRDPREDKSGQVAASTPPQIRSVDPKTLKAGNAAVLQIAGANFADGCVVRIGPESFLPRRISSSALEVSVPANVLKPATHTVVVFNKPPAGDASQSERIIVEA
jgi:hypothetical protein